MIKALAIKELREVLGIAFLGLGTELFLVAAMINLAPFAQIASTLLARGTYVPFLNPNFFRLWCYVGAILAVALGFRQSAWENSRGVYQFLLHRPIRRRTIFLTKLGTGLTVFLLCTGMPILLYALWAATPGNDPSPFEWSMTIHCCQACLTTPLLYGTAFLSGLRPSRWFGTRLLPLLAMLPPVVLLIDVPWQWYLSLPVLLLLYVAVVSNICFVARTRDYA